MFDTDLLKQAQAAIDQRRQQRTKRAFMPGEAMAAADGGGGGGDPSAGGGMPPGTDPSMAGGGGAPPPAAPPPAGGSGMDLQAMIQQQVQTALQGMGGAGAGGAGAQFKPKIDPNVVQLQILKLLAKICDHLQIPIPASDMVVTPTDLMQQAQGGDPSAGGGAGGAGGSPQGNIMPMESIQPIEPAVKQGEEDATPNGEGFHETGLARFVDKTAAVALLQEAQRRRAA